MLFYSGESTGAHYRLYDFNINKIKTNVRIKYSLYW